MVVNGLVWLLVTVICYPITYLIFVLRGNKDKDLLYATWWWGTAIYIMLGFMVGVVVAHI
jgi:hypothetical protein